MYYNTIILISFLSFGIYTQLKVGTCTFKNKLSIFFPFPVECTQLKSTLTSPHIQLVATNPLSIWHNLLPTFNWKWPKVCAPTLTAYSNFELGLEFQHSGWELNFSLKNKWVGPELTRILLNQWFKLDDNWKWSYYFGVSDWPCCRSRRGSCFQMLSSYPSSYICVQVLLPKFSFQMKKGLIKWVGWI